MLKEEGLAKGVIVADMKQIIYCYDDGDCNETALDLIGRTARPSVGEIVSRRGKKWRVNAVKESEIASGRDTILRLHVYLKEYRGKHQL